MSESRKQKQDIRFYIDKDIHRKLKLISLYHEKTLFDLLEESFLSGFDAVINKYPIQETVNKSA